MQQTPQQQRFFFRPPPPFKKGLPGLPPPAPGCASTSRPEPCAQPPALPAVFQFNFEDPKAAKKWQNPKEDLTDYFNYGFTEETWRIYAEKVKKTFAKKADRIPGFDPTLNHFCQSLPLDVGGFGRPVLASTREVPFVKAGLEHPDYLMDTLLRCANPRTLEIMFDKCLYEKDLPEVYEALEQEYLELGPNVMKLGRRLPPETCEPHHHHHGALAHKGHPHPLEVLKAANQRKQLLHAAAGPALLTFEDLSSLAHLFGSILKLPDLHKPADAVSAPQLSRRGSAAEEKPSTKKSETKDTGLPTASKKSRATPSASSSASSSSSSSSTSSSSSSRASSSSSSKDPRPASKPAKREARDTLKRKLKLRRRQSHSRDRSRERSKDRPADAQQLQHRSSHKRDKLKVKRRRRSRSRAQADARREAGTKHRHPQSSRRDRRQRRRSRNHRR